MKTTNRPDLGKTKNIEEGPEQHTEEGEHFET